MTGYSICAEDMGGKGIDLGRAVTEEVGERHCREGVGVGMVGRMFEDHCGEVSETAQLCPVEFSCPDGSALE